MIERFVSAGVVLDGVVAHILYRLLIAPRNRDVLASLPAWQRRELVPALDALGRASRAYEARPLAVQGSTETATVDLGALWPASGGEGPLLDTAQAAALLRITRRRVRQLAAAGLGHRVGGRWAFDSGAVVAAAEARGVLNGQLPPTADG